MFIGDRIGIMSGVYGLMDRVVVDHLINLKEKNRFIPGLRNWIGFSKTSIMYERDERQAGKPQQSIINLFKYGFDAIFSFSYLPLRFSWIFGSFVSVMAFLLATVLIIFRVFNINVVLGFTTQAVLILFIGGIQLITIGIIGEYIGRIYDEVKQRPLYIIENIYKNDL
jgi:glycosyltransferase involved in cell wall biosynthesis